MYVCMYPVHQFHGCQGVQKVKRGVGEGERPGLYSISFSRHEGERDEDEVDWAWDTKTPQFLTPRRPVQVIFAVSLSLSLSLSLVLGGFGLA